MIMEIKISLDKSAKATVIYLLHRYKKKRNALKTKKFGIECKLQYE